jgi:hypothetical protein
MEDITKILEEAEKFKAVGDEYVKKGEVDFWPDRTAWLDTVASANYLRAIYEQNKAIIGLLQKGE